MAWPAEDPPVALGFHDQPVVHHSHPIGDAAHDAQIVGDEQHRHGELPLQLLHQLEDLSLDGHIQSRGRLIGDQQPRLVDQSHGDHHPLTLAPGQLVGEGEQLLLRIAQSHPLQPIQGDRPGLGGRKPSVEEQGLIDLPLHGMQRVE